jgi:hypothetical protein
MPSRAELTEMVCNGASYGELGRKYGLSPGLVHLIVTGLPADGSDVLGPEFLAARPGLLPGSSQHLANPPSEVSTESSAVRTWITTRAATDRALQEAAAARSVAPPPIETDEGDVVDVLGHQHNQAKYVLEELQAMPAEPVAPREAALATLRELLAPHERVEHKHFWPAVRRWLDGGPALADQGEEQEKHAAALLAEAGSDSESVQQLGTELSKHVAFEDVVFLKVRQQIPPEERAHLAEAVRKGT